MKWAKEISDAFFVAAKNKQARQAALLLSAEMRDGLRGTAAGDASTSLSNTFGNWKLDSWSYNSERLSPEKNEASFQGILKSREYGEADFVLRVVKEKDTGLWRVSFLSDGAWKETK